jgi:hypothetical protein
LRSSTRFRQPGVGGVARRRDQQVHGSIPEPIRPSRLQHVHQPCEPCDILPTRPTEQGTPDSEAIRRLQIHPANESDRTVDAVVVETIDLSNVRFSREILDSKRQR